MRAVHSGCAWKPEDACRHAGSGLEQIGALDLRCLGQRRLEKLTHHSEGEVTLQLGPARPQHAHPAVCRRRPRRREQRRLTNPGRSFDHQEPASARASFGQRRFDPRQLLAAFKERSGGRGRFICLETTIEARKISAFPTVRWRDRDSPDGWL